jgi:hypothetical protein
VITRNVTWCGNVLGTVTFPSTLAPRTELAQAGMQALEYCYVHWPAMQPTTSVKVRIVVRAIAQALLGQGEDGPGDMLLEEDIVQLYANQYRAWSARLETFFYAAKLGQPGITEEMVMSRAKR